MEYKNELRTIDTQEKAYLLGFMYGDGTITTYKENSGRQRFLTKISISIKDQDLILLFKNSFPFFNVGNFDYNKYNENCVEQVSVAKSSKELYDDLLSNGVFPRKSYENASKLKIPNIAPDLICHFIRGFFDADGSVYVRAKRKNLITIEFCSVSHEFIISIDTYLRNIGINSWKIVSKQGNSENQVYYQLVFIKTSEILKLIDFMYRDSTISLKRKADKCLNYKPVDKVVERNLTCPRCDSNKVWVNGTRGNSTRYQCRECQKGFSIKNVFN